MYKSMRIEQYINHPHHQYHYKVQHHQQTQVDKRDRQTEKRKQGKMTKKLNCKFLYENQVPLSIKSSGPSIMKQQFVLLCIHLLCDS